MIKADSLAVRVLNFALRIAYRRCDVIADLGICMRRLLIEASGETVGRQQAAGQVQVAEPLPFVAVADNPIGGSDSLWEADAMTRVDEHSVQLLEAECTLTASTAADTEWRSGRYATLVPWSLVEPSEPAQPDALVREQLFGSCTLGLLYSGNFGRAHCFDALLALARQLAVRTSASVSPAEGCGLTRFVRQ